MVCGYRGTALDPLPLEDPQLLRHLSYKMRGRIGANYEQFLRTNDERAIVRVARVRAQIKALNRADISDSELDLRNRLWFLFRSAPIETRIKALEQLQEVGNV